MKKAILAIAAAATIAVGMLGAPNSAEARCRGCGVGVGIIGGLAAGAIIGGAIANSGPRYYGPEPGYVVYDGYRCPLPHRTAPAATGAVRPVRDGYGNVVAGAARASSARKQKRYSKTETPRFNRGVLLLRRARPPYRRICRARPRSASSRL